MLPSAPGKLAKGREGEVWFNATMPYHAGKNNSDLHIRTKYLTQFEAFVTELIPTAAQDLAFGAMVISLC